VATRVLRLAGVRIVFEPGCMAASPIDVTWKEATRFLRRQFLIGRCYAPACWWATVPLMLLQPLILFGGIALAAILAHQGHAYWPWPLLISGSLYGLAVLRGRWRHAVWSSHVRSTPRITQVAARFDQWAAPLSCLFAAGTMLMAAVGRSIIWRGIHYHIGAAGRITLLGRVPNDEQRRQMRTAYARRRDQKQAIGGATASSNQGNQYASLSVGYAQASRV
jgi:hypothetical protein